MTAKASTASIRWPAMERPSGVGSQMTATRAATASRTPQFDRNQVGFAGDGTLAPAGPDIVSMVAMISSSLQQLMPSRSDLEGWLLSEINEPDPVHCRCSNRAAAGFNSSAHTR
jgi:hypothetical protein